MADTLETKTQQLSMDENKTTEAAAPPPTAEQKDETGGQWSAADYEDEGIPDVEILGKSYKPLADGEYDAIIMSTGLKECVLAGLLAVRGLKVLQIDRNPYYGGACASLNMEELFSHFGKNDSAESIRDRFGRTRAFCVDLVPKLLMANGKLVKMLLQTGVTRYIDFNGIAGSYVLNTGKIYKVPVTPAEVMKTSLVGFFQMRKLKSFAEYVATWKAPDRTYERRINSHDLKEIRDAVCEYYKVHNPEKVPEVDKVIEQFADRRIELITALEAKYGVPVFPVETSLSFGPGPLGLRIEAEKVGTSQISLIKVRGFRDIAQGQKGEAETSGKIAPGDILFKINDESFVGKTDQDVLKYLTSAPRPIKMTFIKPVVRSEVPAGQQDMRAVTMRQVYAKYGLDENSQNFIGHAMAFETDDKYLDRPAEETLERVQLYARSVGLYGQDSPYLYPMYGLSSLPEGFSRLAAIYGGTVMLRTDVDEILFNDQGQAVGVRSGDRAAKAKYLIGDASFFPPEKSRPTEKIVRSICILKNPIPKTTGDSAQIILPAKHIKGKTHDVYVSEMGPNHQVCPKGCYIAIASTTVETDNPIAELDAAFKVIGPISERFDSITQSVKPVENGRKDNCYITSTLDATSHFETAARDIMDIYYAIYNKPLDLTEKLVEDPNQQ